MIANASYAWCGDVQRIKKTRNLLLPLSRDAKKWREINRALSIIYFTSTKRVTTVRENENDPPNKNFLPFLLTASVETCAPPPATTTRAGPTDSGRSAARRRGAHSARAAHVADASGRRRGPSRRRRRSLEPTLARANSVTSVNIVGQLDSTRSTRPSTRPPSTSTRLRRSAREPCRRRRRRRRRGYERRWRVSGGGERMGQRGMSRGAVVGRAVNRSVGGRRRVDIGRRQVGAAAAPRGGGGYFFLCEIVSPSISQQPIRFLRGVVFLTRDWLMTQSRQTLLTDLSQGVSQRV